MVVLRSAVVADIELLRSWDQQPHVIAATGDDDRLLEGGIWAEVTLVHNDIDEDDYAFSIEDLRPIQLTRFDFSR